jgi:hypothetical protein
MHTSVITTRLGIASFSAFTLRATGPFSSQPELPSASLCSGKPNKITAGTPTECAALASTTT